MLFDPCSSISIYQEEACWALYQLKFPEGFCAISLCRDTSFISWQLPGNSVFVCMVSILRYWPHLRTFILNIAVKKSRIGSKAEIYGNCNAQAASVPSFILYTTSLFLHNVCQYYTRSLLVGPKTDAVGGVTTRGQAAPTDGERMCSVHLSCFWVNAFQCVFIPRFVQYFQCWVNFCYIVNKQGTNKAVSPGETFIKG